MTSKIFCLWFAKNYTHKDISTLRLSKRGILAIDVTCSIPLGCKKYLRSVLQNVERLKTCIDLLQVSIGNTTVYKREVRQIIIH